MGLLDPALDPEQPSRTGPLVIPSQVEFTDRARLAPGAERGLRRRGEPNPFGPGGI
jgi:hypothetical protein